MLREKFGIENIAMRHEVRKGGSEQECDVPGYSNDARNRAIIVGIKRNLTADPSLQQTQDTLDTVSTGCPSMV